jgi:hypothetical protein
LPSPLKGGSGHSQTVPFLLTSAALSSLLQDWRTAARNMQRALCQQPSPSSRKALEAACAHGRQVCQLLFVVQPVPAGVLLLPCVPSFWALDSQLTYLHKQNTPSPRSALSALCGSLPRTHVWMFGGPASPGLVTLVLKGVLGHTVPVCAAGPTSLCPYFLSLVWCRAGLYRRSEAHSGPLRNLAGWQLLPEPVVSRQGHCIPLP